MAGTDEAWDVVWSGGILLPPRSSHVWNYGGPNRRQGPGSGRGTSRRVSARVQTPAERFQAKLDRNARRRAERKAGQGGAERDP